MKDDERKNNFSIDLGSILMIEVNDSKLQNQC